MEKSTLLCNGKGSNANKVQDSETSLLVTVVVLSLTVEWGVGMERQDPSYGAVVHTSVLRVQALLGRSNSPTSRSSEAVDWIMRVWIQGCEPFILRRGVAYIEFTGPLPPSVMQGLRYI